jgi:hypothetical protein
LFTPCNACPVEFPESSGTPLGIQQDEPISLGFIPRNHHCSEKNPSPSIPIPQLPPNFLNLIRTMCPPEVLLSPLSYELYANNSGAFLRLSCRITCGVNKEKQNMSQTKIRYVKELTNDRYGTN